MFTDEDLGKRVERADGKVIGTVASADGDTARVDPAPDVIDTIKARLGWKEVGDPFVLDATSVREISDTRVHLEHGFSEHDTQAADDDSAHSSSTMR